MPALMSRTSTMIHTHKSQSSWITRRTTSKVINELQGHCNMRQTMEILCHVLLFVLFLHSSIATDPLGNFCNEESVTSSKRSTISANIDDLLAKLVSQASSNGYASISLGQGQDKIYGLAQCRGDVSSKDCSGCLQDAAKQIRQLCQNQTDARIWYDYCFLRYKRQDDFIGEVDTGFGIFYYNVENVTDPECFNRKLGVLMNNIRSEAVVEKNEGLGEEKTELSTFVTLYALVQCTRDLATIDCAQCLAIAVNNFPNFCNNRKGCRVLYSSCYVRYELYPFFFPLDSTSSSIGHGNSTSVAAIIVHP